ncbi:hypothetical protein NW766_001938 [Fusarium irregulare]|uniref:Uncharacterized protein n=1 Tax=Fusarium irregulare TaxID=2494466 RepID=A0A9W8UDL5_9HYPO|nr:hypothetical protein NW766_001938 [Fusarium irregulare]
MDPTQTASGKIPKVKAGIQWKLKAGQLTIVDLSCPCVTAEAACSLFPRTQLRVIKELTRARRESLRAPSPARIESDTKLSQHCADRS